MNLMELVIAGIMLVVLGFVLTIGQNITSQSAKSQCSGTWVDNWFNTTNTTATSPNPLDNSFSGCCVTTNTSYNYPQAGLLPGVCAVWKTDSYALNSSYYAMSANNTLAYWVPIIALAMAAGFVIAILITYLLGAVVGKHQATI